MLVCWNGKNALRRSNGVEVHRGEEFDANNGELIAFGDLMCHVAVAKSEGFYKGAPTRKAQLESVDAARTRIHSEENARARAAGRPVPYPEIAESKPQEAPEEPAEPSGEEASGGDEITKKDLEGMTIAELKQFASENDIETSGMRTKAELVDGIWTALP